MAGTHYTDWKPVDVIDNTTALLPVDRPVSAFRYRKDLIIEVFLPSHTTAPVVDIEWQWTFNVKRNGVIEFKSETTWTARIVAFTDPLFGALGLVTWQPLGDAGEGTIETTIINGEEIDPAESWRYIDVGHPTVNSEEGYTVFEEEGVATLGAYRFFATWYSPAWRQRLVPGDILDAVDATNIGSIPDEATYEVSLKYGSPRIVDTAFDGLGALISNFNPRAGRTMFSGMAWPGYLNMDRGSTATEDGDTPSVLELRDGRLIAGIMTPAGYVEYLSRDSQRTWKRMLYPDPESPPEKIEEEIWSGSAQMPQLLLLENDTRISLAIIAGELCVRQITDNGPSSIVVVGPANSTQSYALAKDGTGLLTISDSTGLPVWKSYDLGLSWKPVPRDEE